MPSVWQSLRKDMMRAIQTLSARREFLALKQDRPALQRFTDAASLLDSLHGDSRDLDDKDRVLAALVCAVQTGRGEAELPELLLWLALWPGLDALYHRLWRHFADAQDNLAAEIAVQFTLAIRRADLSRIRRLAATLVRNVERNARIPLRRARDAQARQVEFPDHGDPGAACCSSPSAFGMGPSGVDTTARLLRERLFRAMGAEADLVVAVILVGERPGEIARRLGIRPEAARKRCQRAMESLRQCFSET